MLLAAGAARQIVLRCIVSGKDLLVEPGAGNRPEFLPQLQLDELLGELQARIRAVLATRDQMRGLLQAVVAISSGLAWGSPRGGSSRPRSGWWTRPTGRWASSARTGGWPRSSRSACAPKRSSGSITGPKGTACPAR